MNKLLTILAVATAVAGCASPTPAEKPQSARNVILFIGDGMGVSTVTAARIFDGQSRGLAGEEHVLAFEEFPNVALVKTYNTNQQVPDSAGTATAMMTGTKTRAGVINVSPDAARGSCAGALENPLVPLSRTAKERGLAVGVVTTTRLTHATPATVYANSPERDWESDKYLSDEQWALGCRDIAWQLTHPDDEAGLDIAMGGGRGEFVGAGGNRKDPAADLIADWLAASPDRQFVDTAEGLKSLRPGANVIGLFSRSHMSYVARRKPDTTQPMLAELTAAAIDHLAGSPDGYFLMVEGGRIDHGHHIGKPGYALVETQAFARAVETALARVDLDDTLILVTADHSHAFTLAGYPTRGNPILGLVVENDRRGEPNPSPSVDADGVPYTSVGYANGPGAVRQVPRPEPETGVYSVAQALVPVVHTRVDGSPDNGETHSGEDVALYAIGPGSDAVRGVIEQNRIFDIMRAAYGW
ncbi:MAG: alkaline phosphatase [Woeseiaceae bacterium]|nr:alkaline phosphatase [Woeseiaceae bacterium]